MGDYTNAQLTVYSCPPEEVREFIGCMEEYGLRVDYGDEQPPADEIILGHTYADNDVNIGFINDYSIDAPNSAWVRWNDPKYEYLGDLEIHVPGLGYFTAQCDADGNGVFTPEAIIKVIEELPEDAHRDQVLQAIGKLTGRAWWEAIDKLITWKPPAEGPTVKAAPICGWCEEFIDKVDDAWVHRATGLQPCAEQPKRLACPSDEGEG